jgi:hypothetical protein
MIAGIAAVGASLIVANPMTPSTDMQPNVQQRAVKLVATELDWATVISDAEANLQALQTDAGTAGNELSTAFTGLSSEFGGQFSTALSGFELGVQNSLDGGWYGGDDGYVFGLFGGTVTNPATGISETGSLLGSLSADFQAGNTEQAFSDFNAWSLETLDHTLKPLLSPLLDETTKGATTFSIPVELSQLQTNLLESFGNYDELKSAAESVLSPEISAAFAFTQDLDGIQAAFAAGDTTLGLTDIKDLPSDVFGAFVNGYDFGTNPFNGAAELFPGLLNDGSLLQDLLVTWPEQLASVLTESTTAATTEAVSTATPDLITGLLGGL